MLLLFVAAATIDAKFRPANGVLFASPCILRSQPGKSSRNDAQNFRAFCLNLRASTGFVARYRTRLSCLNLSASSHIDLLASPRANSPASLRAKSRTLGLPGSFMKYPRRPSDPSAASLNLSKSKPGFKRNLTLKFASAKPARSRPLRFFARFTRADAVSTCS